MTEEQGKDMENRLKKLTKNHQMQKYILAAALNKQMKQYRQKKAKREFG